MIRQELNPETCRLDQHVEHPINNVLAMVFQNNQKYIGDMVSAKRQIVATVKK